MTFIADMKEHDLIVGHYFCKSKQSLKTRVGKTYYSLKLQDKTGMVDAKVWELTKDIQDFNEGEMIKIDASVLSYNNEIQVKVNKIRRSQHGEYVLSDFIPSTTKDVEKMYGQVVGIIKSIENLHLKTLLENILVKDEARAKALKTHSAAKQIHHGYMGGLLEHTVSVAQICDFVCKRYDYVNRDLLLTGALLHDIGKIYELSPMPYNEYTDDGQLLGHLVMGVEMIAVEIAKIEGFPHQLASLVKHMIVSHHGELEFGSPKVPAIAEATILYYADNMDAKVKTIEELLDSDTSPGPWVGYHKALSRYIRKSEF